MVNLPSTRSAANRIAVPESIRLSMRKSRSQKIIVMAGIPRFSIGPCRNVTRPSNGSMSRTTPSAKPSDAGSLGRSAAGVAAGCIALAEPAINVPSTADNESSKLGITLRGICRPERSSRKVVPKGRPEN